MIFWIKIRFGDLFLGYFLNGAICPFLYPNHSLKVFLPAPGKTDNIQTVEQLWSFWSPPRPVVVSLSAIWKGLLSTDLQMMQRGFSVRIKLTILLHVSVIIALRTFPFFIRGTISAQKCLSLSFLWRRGRPLFFASAGILNGTITGRVGYVASVYDLTIAKTSLHFVIH